MKKLSHKQRREVSTLKVNAYAMRGVQLFVIGLAVYLAIAENRGWPCIVIGLFLAAWFEAHLPTLPDWLAKLKEENERDE